MILWMILLAAPLLAQTSDGVIGGVLRDSSGAVLSGASVEAENRQTGVLNKTRTNAEGIYVFPALAVGRYRLRGEAPGFRRTVLEGIDLAVGGRLSLDLTLELATATESVDVVADAKTDLAYATSNVGGVVEGKRVLELPVTSRDALTLATTQAGSYGSYYSGARIGTLNIQVDGTNIQDARINQGRSSPFFLSVDRIAEFRVITSPADAEYGRGSGQIQMITRSGTNELHGSLFNYLRNTALNANTWFNNFQGSDRNGNAIAPRNILVRNQFGVRVGGPVVLPKLYNGKNKTFFHVLYEGQRQRQQSRVTRTVFSDQARQGNFRFYNGVQNGNASAALPSVDFAGNPVRPVGATGDLQTISVFGRDVNRMAADSTGLVKKMLDLMPSPNVFTTGDGLNTAGYAWVQPFANDRDQYNVKIDHNLNDKHRVSFSWNREDSISRNGFQSQRFPNTPGGDVSSPDSVYSLRFFSALRSNLTNEFSVGTLRSKSRSLAPWEVEGGLDALPRIGNQPFLLDFVSVTDPILTDNDPQGRLTPNYQYGDAVSWFKGKHNVKAGASVWFVSTNGFNSFDVMPRVNIGQGIIPVANFANIPGIGRNQTTAENLLNDLAGSVTSVVQAFNSPGGANPAYVPGETKARVWKNREYAFYLKDDWRIAKSVTLNLGVRYEFNSVPYDKNGKTAGVVGGSAGLFGISGSDFSALFRPGASGGSLSQVELIGPGTSKPDTRLFAPDRNNFAPAVGLSWAIPGLGKNKTILRLGYSMGYERTALRLADVVSGDQPGLRQRRVLNVPGFTNLRAVGLPLQPTEAPLATVPLTDRQQTIRAFDSGLRNPYVQNWNASIQRSLPGDFILDLRYVGNKGTKLLRTTNLNETNIFENGLLPAFLDAQAGRENALLDQVLSGIRGTQSGSTFMRTNATLAGYLAGNSVGAFAGYINSQNVQGRNGGLLSAARLPENFIVANPQFSGANLVGNFANSTYHSLQIDVSKRFAKGLTMQANYTWARGLGEEEGDGQELLDSYRTLRNRRLEKRLLAFSAPHVFRSNGLWDMPIGPGRALLGGSRGAWGKLLEHWQVGFIFNAFAGVPFSWDSGRSSLNSFSGDNTASFVAPVSGKIGKVEKRGNGVFFYGGYSVVTDPQVQNLTTLNGVQGRSTLLSIADPSGKIIAVNPAPGTLGNSPLRYFFGPGYFNFDMNLLKTITIREKFQVQFSAVADGILNKAQFTDPVNNLNSSINSLNFGQITGSDDSGNRVVVLSLRVNF